MGCPAGVSTWAPVHLCAKVEEISLRTKEEYFNLKTSICSCTVIVPENVNLKEHAYEHSDFFLKVKNLRIKAWMKGKCESGNQK